MNFLIYHSGFVPDAKEGPYVQDRTDGVDSLIRRSTPADPQRHPVNELRAAVKFFDEYFLAPFSGIATNNGLVRWKAGALTTAGPTVPAGALAPPPG